ncbi:MAG: sulfite exporter TauE/SafE family protein [Chloroflexi bacterium]|nr:sulfite exporter TauE/SafE family protein [Chloroflexota bacterium]
MNKTTIRVRGMHCRSCEMRIEAELSKMRGVREVRANSSNGKVDVYHASDKINQKLAEKKLRDIGYEPGVDTRPLFSKNSWDYVQLAVSLVLLIELYFILKYMGLFGFGVSSSQGYASLPLVFLVGLTAGISTCMALVGGLLLGVSARFAEKHPDASPVQKFKPHLFFNTGRIILFTILGGLIGYLGSFMQLSGTLRGLMMVAVAAVMAMVGLQLTGIMPRLDGVSFTLPKALGARLGIQTRTEKEYSTGSAMMLGGLTFFLPCGFTQAMQLYAISSGSFLTGALTLGVFAIGTAPGLLTVGGVTSVVRGSFAKPFYKFAGLAVVAMALFNAANGMSLAGLRIAPPSTTTQAAVASANAQLPPVQNGVQIVNMTQSSDGYTPNQFTVAKGIPVKWVINSEDASSCASAIVSDQLGINKYLNAGENVIQFTPTQTGQISFSCSMGMYYGVFNVVDSQGTQTAS